MQSVEERISRGSRSVLIGLAANALLAVVKIVTGVFGNSYALIADGIESSADIVSSLVVLRGLKLAARDANERYHFGYGRAESVAAALVSLILLGAAVGIGIEGFREIRSPHHAPAEFTLLVLIFVIVIKEFLFRRLFSVGSEVQSTAIVGEAWHHRSDAITSAAAFFGIGIAIIGGPGWESADDYAAIICALVIGYNGWRMLTVAVLDLMDRAPDSSVTLAIEGAALSVPGVQLVEKVLVRKVGLEYFVDMHVHADPEMQLRDAHILSGKVKTAVRGCNPAIRGVLIHMEPTDSPLSETLG